MNIMDVGKNITWRERGINIIFSIIIRLLGRISSGAKGRGREFLWRISRGGISSCRELYTPLFKRIKRSDQIFSMATYHIDSFGIIKGFF